MLHGAIFNFRRRIVNQTRGFSCRVAAQFNHWLQATPEFRHVLFPDSMLRRTCSGALITAPATSVAPASATSSPPTTAAHPQRHRRRLHPRRHPPSEHLLAGSAAAPSSLACRAGVRAETARRETTTHPRSVKYKRARQKAISYVEPSIFDMLAGASPASARDGWAE